MRARKISAIGNRNRKRILRAAEKEFEQYGFGGARMRRIADFAGMPKANVHYYFSGKLALYNAVLERIVDLWDQAFETLDTDDDPASVLRDFVRKKVEFTRLYPRATRIFASEILHGRPYLSDQLNDRMTRWTRERAAVIRQWVDDGKIAVVDPFHLIFLIWSSTQHFALSEAQIASVYEKRGLTQKDYLDQSVSLTTMVMRICGLPEDASEVD